MRIFTSLRLPFIATATLLNLETATFAQNVQPVDVMVNGALRPGYNAGVNSSGNRNDWLTQDTQSLKMSYPASQEWGAVFFTFGPSVNPPRPGEDFTSEVTLAIEVRGDSGKVIQLGVKDKNQKDDGTETKVDIILTGDWRTYTVPLSAFRNAGINALYVVTEFIFAGPQPVTAYVRNIRFTPQPAAVIKGVANAASFQSGIGLGAWVSVVGENLAGTARSWSSGDFVGGRLPLSLDGVSVSLNERSLPIAFASSGQINALIPLDAITGAAYLTATNSFGTSLPLPVTVASVFPGLFAVDPAYKYVAALHLDGTLVGKPGLLGNDVTARPAAPGEIIQVFGSGFGQTNPPSDSTAIVLAPAQLADPAKFQFTIGNQAGAVGYAGLVGSGLYQFNVTVPLGAANGDLAVRASINGVDSSGNLFVTVRK